MADARFLTPGERTLRADVSRHAAEALRPDVVCAPGEVLDQRGVRVAADRQVITAHRNSGRRNDSSRLRRRGGRRRGRERFADFALLRARVGRCAAAAQHIAPVGAGMVRNNY